MQLAFSDELFDYYSVTLSLTDNRIAYVFEVGFNGAKAYYCEDGLVNSYDFTLAYFNSFQFAYIHPSDIVERVDWLTNAVFYQIFTDRFCKPEGKAADYITSQWGELPTPKSFYGGDLNGIRSKIPYIKSLNVTALYLTPIFKSKSNHKYDTIDFYAVDEMFGGNDALKALVDECHRNGIRVVLDAVFNHVSSDFAQFRDVVVNGKQSEYYDWFVIDGDAVDVKRGTYAVFASCCDMPKLNTDNAEVQRYLIDVALHYMDEYHIDGWRLDVSDEVSHDFWRKFRQAVKGKNKDCALIGENWHDSQSFLQGDQFDSIMNYALTKQMMDYWVDESIDEQTLAARLNRQLSRYNDVTNAMMFNLLDCHDTHRFYSLVGCSKDKLLCAVATMTFMNGSYNLYYGDEVLTEGGYDPDCRRTFDWDKLNDPEVCRFVDKLRQLFELKRQPAFKCGRPRIYAQDGRLVIEREAANQTYTLKVSRRNDSYTIQHNGRLL